MAYRVNFKGAEVSADTKADLVALLTASDDLPEFNSVIVHVCPLCNLFNTEPCGAKHSPMEWSCTRSRRHPGPHITCTPVQHATMMWGDSDKPGDKATCPWCINSKGDLSCGSRQPPSGSFGETYRCTRPDRHNGYHVACSFDNHKCATWDSK